MRDVLFFFRMAFLLLAGFTSCSEKLPAGDDLQDGSGNEFEQLPETEIELYSYSDQIIPSVLYSVEVGGEKVMVLPTIEHHVCAFGAGGPVVVKVDSYSEVIESVKVLPVSKNYTYRISDGVVEVIMSPGDEAVIEINGKEDNDLFVFVNPLETDKPDESSQDVLYFKSGTVTDISSLSVKSGQTVYIEGGAVVKGNLTSPLNSSDITIKGCGIIDSRDVSSRGIQLHKVENLTIENLILLNNINWSTFIAEGNNVRITNYKVVAVENPEHETGCENDALDILGCKDVVVKGCFGYAHDDVFCVKSHKWDYKGTVDNVLFEDCVAWNYLSGNSFVVGAETNENVSNVTYRNCYSIHSGGRSSTLYRGGLSVHHCAGGHVSDILFENIFLEDCKEYGIYLDIRKSYVSNLGNGVEWSPGTCDGIVLRNVNILKAPKYGSVVAGYDNDEHKIKNLVFDNVVQESEKISSSNVGSFISISNADYSFL